MPRASEGRGLQSVCPLILTPNGLLLAQKIMFGDWGVGSVGPVLYLTGMSTKVRAPDLCKNARRDGPLL